MSYTSDIDRLIEDLQRLRKEANNKIDIEWKAEPFAYHHPSTGWQDGNDDDWYVYSEAGNITGNGQYKEDAIYIAALHNSVPFLIEEIERLNGLINGNKTYC